MLKIRQLLGGSTQESFSRFAHNLIGKINGKFYNTEIAKTNSIHVSVFDYGLAMEKTIEIQAPPNMDKFEYQKQIIVADKIYILALERDGRKNRSNLMLCVLNDDLTIMKEWQMVYSFLGIINLTVQSYNDSKEIVVFYQNRNPENLILNFIIFDDQFNYKAKQAKTIGNSTNFDIFQELYTTDGNYFGIAKHNGKMSSILYNYAENSLFVKEVDGNFVGIKLIENNSKNTIYCAGFYDIDSTYNDGTYFFSINTKTGELSQTIKTLFDKEFVKNFITKENEKRETRIPFHVLKNGILNNDGNIILIAEQDKYWDKMVTIKKGNYSYRERIYYLTLKDLIVTCLSPKGEIIWTKVIPKSQENRLGYVASISYTFYQNDKELNIVFYNSHLNYEIGKKSLKYVTDVYDYWRGKHNLMRININYESGVVNPVVVANVKEVYNLIPTACRQIGNELIFYVYFEPYLFNWKFKYRFGKMKF